MNTATQNITYTELKIQSIMKDIIYLKTENRHISQRINHLDKCRSDYIKIIKNNKGNHAVYKEFDKKLDSSINLSLLLCKLQRTNSKTILKHRAKIQELRKEIENA